MNRVFEIEIFGVEYEKNENQIKGSSVEVGTER